MNKYEQLIEFIINEQEDKARELFHTIVVEKSREVYESLIDEQDLAEIGGNDVEQMVDEITMDEEGVSEDDDMEADDMEIDADAEAMDMDGEVADMADDAEGDLEDKVMSLEDELESLKAKFAELMGDDEVAADMDQMDGDMGDVEMDAEEEFDDQEMEGYTMEAKAEKQAMKDVKKDAKKMTEAEWIREYVEKVNASANSETQEVGQGGSVSLNTKSTVAGKNDMGGKVVGGSPANADPKGTPSDKPSGLLKAGGEFVGKVQNRPGSDAGKTSYASKAPAAKSGEEAGTNNKSPLAK
jgi:hypothetical protein